MSWAKAKLVAEIVDLLAGAYGKIEERRLARANAERDEKIRALERQVAELKEKLK